MELTDALATDGIALIAWQYQDDGADEDELRDWVELYLSHHKRGVTSGTVRELIEQHLAGEVQPVAA